MPFATTWMDLEITMLSQRQIYDITYIWNLKKNDRNEFIYKQKQIQRLSK